MRKVNIDDLITELDDARQTAKDKGQASAMIAATMSKAKLLGLDKADSDNDSEPLPVQVIVNVVEGRKPEQVQ